MKNNISKETKIKDSIHDYDQEYEKGAHWDVEEPSSNMGEFIELIKGSEKVLDAGCGVGRDAIFLAKKGFKVTGVDSSSVAIALAKNKVLGLPNLSLMVGRIEDLDFPDSTFDAAYSGYVLGGHTLPQQAKELARVIKSDGVLYVAMFTKTKYDKPNERDEENPLPFVFESFGKWFDIKKQSRDSYIEEDDQGKHVHERLKLTLRKI